MSPGPDFAAFSWAAGLWEGVSEEGSELEFTVDESGAPVRLDRTGVEGNPRTLEATFGCTEVFAYPLVFDDPNYQECSSALSCGNSWEHRLVEASVAGDRLSLEYAGRGEMQSLELRWVADGELGLSWSFLREDGRTSGIEGTLTRVDP